MLRLGIVYLAGRLRASHPLIRRIGLLLTVCSSPPLTVERTFSPSSLCGVLAKPDWTETCTLQEFEPPPCRVAWLKTLVSVCFSFCCCSVCLRFWQQNCHLLCCTCLCLWESCYSISGFRATVSEWLSECVCVRVCLWMWMQGSGKSSTHLNKLFSCFTSIHPLFSLVAPCSLNQGFITKQVCQCPQMPRVDTVSGGGVTKDGKASCIFDKDLFS